MAAKKAAEWCAKRKGWTRICDLKDGESDTLYVTWEEMSARMKAPWIKHYGFSYAQATWEAHGCKKCKVKSGYIGQNGVFYEDMRLVPPLCNIMMVFKIGDLAKWRT